MQSIEVRKANRDDCQAISTLIRELANFEKMPDGPKIDYQILERDGFGTEKPLFICYVATVDKRIIGYAFSYFTYSTWFGKAMYLEDIYVKTEFRRQRIGNKLLKAIAKEAMDNNCCRLDFIVLKWNPAQDFYRSKGAVNITKEEGWYHYRFDQTALKNLITK